MRYSSEDGQQPSQAEDASGYPQAEMDYGSAYRTNAQYPQQPAAPTGLSQSAYADNSNAYDYNQGYAHRQGFTGSAPSTTSKPSKFGFLKSKWPAVFMVVASTQAVLCLTFEAFLFAQFEVKLRDGNSSVNVESQKKTIPTFLALFIFGFLYELVLVWDALRMKNTIQIIGICIANLALMIYASLQINQIRDALVVLYFNGALEPGLTIADLWNELRPFLFAIPSIIAFMTFIMAGLCWKLYQKFAWDILKNIGADYRMKKRFLQYQIYIALLKFDFFFFLGFIVQFVVIVAARNNIEFPLTIATIPFTIIVLIAAAWFIRIENRAGMVIVILLYFGGLSYFIFKLARIYEPNTAENYSAVQKSLTAFAVITILLIILTIGNAIVCMMNFGNGLKTHLISKTRKRSEEEPDVNSIGMNDVKQQLPSRMTID